MSNDIEAKIDGRSREARMAKAGGATGKESTMDSRARAEARIREIRENIPDGGAVRDKFYAPPPPDGWDYQWKMKTVLGEEFHSYQVELLRNGWEPVPIERHPELMPQGWTGRTIEVEGLVLMERPKVFTDEARADEARSAREAVLTKEAQLRDGRAGDLGNREVHRFSKSRSPIAIPGDE
jgi:hypothetical protein